METRRSESCLRHGINRIQRVEVGIGEREETRMSFRFLAYIHSGWYTIGKSISSISCLRTLRLRGVKWPAQGCVPSKRHSQPGLQASRLLPFQLQQATPCVRGPMGIVVLGNEVPGAACGSAHQEEGDFMNGVFWAPYSICFATKHNACGRAFVALRLLWLTYQCLWKVQLTWFQPFCIPALEADDRCRSVKEEKIFS